MRKNHSPQANSMCFNEAVKINSITFKAHLTDYFSPINSLFYFRLHCNPISVTFMRLITTEISELGFSSFSTFFIELSICCTLTWFISGWLTER